MERDRPARATVLFTDSDGITASPSWHALALPEVCERLSATPAGLDSLVRAKVAYLEHQSGGEKAVCLARYERHLALAGRYAERRVLRVSSSSPTGSPAPARPCTARR